MRNQHEKFQCKTLLLIVFVLCCQSLFSGCEPLKRKFIRKKRKEPLEATVEPIFDPETYPEKVKDTEQLYRSYYDLCLIWNKEVIANLEERMSDKKVLFSLNKLLKEMRKMESLVRGEPGKTIKDYQESLEKMIQEFSSPVAFRNYRGYIKKLMSMDRKIRKELNPELVLNDLSR